MTAATSAPPVTRRPPLAADYRRRGLWRGETIWDTFSATATQHAGRTAAVEGDVRTSFAALAGAAERLAAGLATAGIRPGDVVALQLPNWTETLVVLLARARLGVSANPILPVHRQREVGFALREAGARAVFVPGRYRDCDHRALLAALRPALPALAHVIVVRDDAAGNALPYAGLAASDGAAPSPPVDAEAVALLMYTSGTTADAKGVLHSHETLLAEARSLGPVHGPSAADTVLMPSPLTHISGLMHALVVPAAHGSTAVLMDRCEGEILARGPECFLGYRNPALDADAFTPDGWFRTGDLGTLDADGYLRITGRRKDIIIRKGENISARELEDLLAAHPAVAEVAVVGIPDAAAGEIACAVVRLRPGERGPTLADLTTYLTARGLSRRKLPDASRWWRTSRGRRAGRF